MLSRLHRLAAILLPPVAGLLVYAAASAASDAIGQTQAILGALESKRAAPAPSSSAAASGSSSSDAGPPSTPRSSPVVAADGAIAQAKKLLERASQLRALGDGARAALAEDGALEWAETARDLVAAVEDERAADDQGQAAVALTTKAERARQLLEEAIARRGRLQGVLDGLDAQQLGAAQKSLDGGATDAAPKKKAAGQ